MFIRHVRSTTLFATATAILIAILFYDVVLGLGTFNIRDYSIFAYPLAQYHRYSFWNGEIPLWNPYNNCGLPFLAQWSTLVLYPGSLIYLLFPLPWSLGIYCLIHLWFGGVGMYRLARTWTGNELAAAIAALAFVFNGFMLNCLSWPAFLATMVWMPWVIWLVTLSWSGDRRTLAWAALAGAMQMLTGGPEVIFLTWVFVGALWMGELARHSAKKPKVFFTLPLAVILISLLSAAQLLPFFDLLADSQRSAAYADSSWSMPKWGLANLLVPLFRFYRAPDGVYFQTGQDWTSSYYLGIGVVFLVITAMVFVRKYRVALLSVFSIVALLLALGDNTIVYPWARKLFPQLGFMRFPIKFMLFPAFAFPLLAGFGSARLMELIEQAPKTFKKWVIAAGASLAALTLAIVFYGKANLLSNETWQALRNSGLSRVFFLVFILAAFWVRDNARLTRISAALLLGLFMLDPWTHAPSQNPRVPLSVYEPGLSAREMKPTPKLGEARAMLTKTTHDRIYGSMLKDPVADYFGRRMTLLGNSSLIDRIPNIDGFFPLYLGRPREVWSALFFNPRTNETTGLADFLGVSQVSHPEQILAWAHREGAMPMITAGQRPVVLEPKQILAAMTSPEFRPREVVYVESDQKAPGLKTNQTINATVSEINVGTHFASAHIEAKEPTLAVISQAFTKNWQARVDGTSVPILRANYAFQAVALPAGAHQLVLRYEDRSFRIGAFFSLTGLTVIALLFTTSALKRKSPPPFSRVAGVEQQTGDAISS